MSASPVIPAEAGIQGFPLAAGLDSQVRLRSSRGNDEGAR